MSSKIIGDTLQEEQRDRETLERASGEPPRKKICVSHDSGSTIDLPGDEDRAYRPKMEPAARPFRSQLAPRVVTDVGPPVIGAFSPFYLDEYTRHFGRGIPENDARMLHLLLKRELATSCTEMLSLNHLKRRHDNALSILRARSRLPALQEQERTDVEHVVKLYYNAYYLELMRVIAKENAAALRGTKWSIPIALSGWSFHSTKNLFPVEGGLVIEIDYAYPEFKNRVTQFRPGMNDGAAAKALKESQSRYYNAIDEKIKEVKLRDLQSYKEWLGDKLRKKSFAAATLHESQMENSVRPRNASTVNASNTISKEARVNNYMQGQDNYTPVTAKSPAYTTSDDLISLEAEHAAMTKLLKDCDGYRELIGKLRQSESDLQDKVNRLKTENGELVDKQQEYKDMIAEVEHSNITLKEACLSEAREREAKIKKLKQFKEQIKILVA